MSIKILIVDTDPDVRHLIDVRLRRVGYEIQSAGSAEEAVELLNTPDRADILITEVLLPEMDGIALTQHAKALANPPLVLFLTALTNDSHIAAGLAAGADDYVTKPFSPLVLIERLRVNLIRSGRATPQMVTAQERDDD